MHYAAEIWLPNSEKNAKAVKEYGSGSKELMGIIDPILQPFSEYATKSTRAFFDYWQIGGRWTGLHDGYRANEDIINQETCNLCGGTGTRTDMKSSMGCNGCSGRGSKTKWTYAPHQEDALPLSEIKDDLTCYTLIVPLPRLKKAKVFHKKEWDGNTYVEKDFTGKHLRETLKKKYDIKDGFLITLDYHC